MTKRTAGREGDSEARRRRRSSGGLSSVSPVLLVSLSVVMLVSTACSLGGTATPPPTRAATQTPWIVYVPITVTPMPATFTPLPTITVVRQSTATRAPVKPAATKAPVVVPTKPPVPVAVAPTATPAPACSAPAVQLRFPKNGDPRKTKQSGPASDVFDFQWSPYQPGEADSQTGYLIRIDSKYVGTNRTIGGDAKYISHNGFLKNGGHFIYDARAVHGLIAAGESDVAVFWNVTVVKTTGSFDDVGGVSGQVVNCSPPSQTWTISLIVLE